MKVLQINSTCGIGSTGRIAVSLLEALENMGDEGIIAFGRGGAPQNVNSYRIGSDLGVKFHGALSRITDRQAFYSSTATKKLIKFIKNYSPDIIHLHNIHGYYLNVKLLFEFLAEYKAEVVWTLHDCWAFTGHCAYFDYVGCDKWQQECCSCPQKSAYPSSLLIDNSKNNYSLKKKLFTSLEKVHIVTPSFWLADTVNKSFLNKYPVTTIYNGINLEIFKPTKSDFKEKNGFSNKKIVLGVANIWEKRKGLEDFITLSKMLPADYIVVLVGLNSKQISALPDNIIGIEKTESAEELAAIYSAADVYVNASVEETMGLTTVEALACGTPAVVYNATAVPEIVDISSGITVPVGNIDELLNAVLSVNVKAENCIKRAELFEENKQYKKYLELYKNILSGR